MQELRLRWSNRCENLKNLKAAKSPNWKISATKEKKTRSFFVSQARRQQELKQLREEQRLHEKAKAGLGAAVEGEQFVFSCLLLLVFVCSCC